MLPTGSLSQRWEEHDTPSCHVPYTGDLASNSQREDEGALLQLGLAPSYGTIPHEKRR
jgi:hypothetical protein